MLVIPIRRCTVDQLRLQFTKTPHERKSSLQRNHPLNFCFFKLSFHIHRILSLSLEPSPTGDPSIFLTSTRHHLPSHLLLWHIIVHSYTRLQLIFQLMILLVDDISLVELQLLTVLLSARNHTGCCIITICVISLDGI